MHEASWHWVKWLRPSLSGKTFCQLVEACWLAPSPLSPLVLSPLVLCSWGFRGLLGRSWGPRGGLWGPWAAPGAQLASLGPCLGRSWGPLGPPLATLGPLLGRPWASPHPSWVVLDASWASPVPPLGAPGALLAAKGDFSRNTVKTMVFPWFWRLRGPPGSLLEGPWGCLGGSWVPLGPS